MKTLPIVSARGTRRADCNAKIVAMLASVPAERRSSRSLRRRWPRTHLITAREIWLSRLGHL